MSYNDDLMRAAKNEEEEFNRQFKAKDDIMIPVAVAEALNGWMEFLDNWATRSRYLRVVPMREQQIRLDYWDSQIARFDNHTNEILPQFSNWDEE